MSSAELGRGRATSSRSPGSTRDGDPRACYVLFDGERVRYRRVEYDVEEARRKIHAVSELERVLGDRLREGR